MARIRPTLARDRQTSTKVGQDSTELGPESSRIGLIAANLGPSWKKHRPTLAKTRPNSAWSPDLGKSTRIGRNAVNFGPALLEIDFCRNSRSRPRGAPQYGILANFGQYRASSVECQQFWAKVDRVRANSGRFQTSFGRVLADFGRFRDQPLTARALPDLGRLGTTSGVVTITCMERLSSNVAYLSVSAPPPSSCRRCGLAHLRTSSAPPRRGPACPCPENTCRCCSATCDRASASKRDASACSWAAFACYRRARVCSRPRAYGAPTVGSCHGS